MYPEIAAGAYLLGSYAYHRWFADPPLLPPAAKTVALPKTDDGAAVPLLFGRCRVRQPWLAWNSNFQTTTLDGTLGIYQYQIDLFFVVGIPLGSGLDTRFHYVWIDNDRLPTPLDGLDSGDEGVTDNSANGGSEATGFAGGRVEVFMGDDDQLFVADLTPFAALTGIGTRLKAEASGDGTKVSSFRGYMSILLFDTGGTNKWNIGKSPRVGAYGFEVHTCATTDTTFAIVDNGFGVGVPSPTIGDEMNPIDALANVLTGTFGKAGLPTSILDADSFTYAASLVAVEENGFSIAIEDYSDVSDVIDLILRQVDGLIYYDPDANKIFVKLIRDDYDPDDVPEINPSVCDKLENMALGGRTSIPNKIRVQFTERASDYNPNSVFAANQANAVGSVYGVVEQVVQYPAVCTKENAQKLATRELAARSRPIAKLRATLDRTFLRTKPGDVLAITWPDWGWSRMLFRVASTDQGVRDDGSIVVDLIQEFFFSNGSANGTATTGAELPSYPVADPT